MPLTGDQADAIRQGLKVDTGGRRRRGRWPDPMGRQAFHGLAGEFVDLVAPTTEADQQGLLVQFLAAAGNVIGRGPGIVADGTFHPPNIWAVLIGESAKARKGTSWARNRQLFELVDDDWVRARVSSGLSSGEGLAWQVRDERIIRRKAKRGEDGDEDGMVEEVADEGVVDKRLLVMETEFAQPFRAMQRDGNTLAIALRCAWDTTPIGGLTKKEPTRAHHHHITLVGHITAAEARRVISETDIRSGLVNRMLLCCVKRARELPAWGGGHLDSSQLAKLSDRVRHAVRVAQTLRGNMDASDEAKGLWEARYHRLTAPKPGSFGDAVARAEAQVLRLSSVYALLDEAAVVGTSHLEAALEVWRYCEDSARYVFGDRTGDRLADKFLAALRRRPGGMTRTELRDEISGSDVPVERIEEALEVLEAHQLAHCVEEKDTGGRPAERWFAATDRRDG
jgi:hypothetical protein